jgi:hypothetical protein
VQGAVGDEGLLLPKHGVVVGHKEGWTGGGGHAVEERVQGEEDVFIFFTT